MNAAHRIPLLPVEEHERRMRRANSPHRELWALLDTVKDPEIPVVSLWELGILQDVEETEGVIVVTITPTYSGCPAMSVIEEDIIACLASKGIDSRVQSRLAPAWSTSWISEDTRRALKTYGIAPPCDDPGSIACPQCGSAQVRLISEFASTACKALYQCSSCREPFDYFKHLREAP